MDYKVLYNPFAGRINDAAFHTTLESVYKDDHLDFYDITKVTYPEFFSALDEKDRVIIAGGDGTLNRFINDVEGLDIQAKLYYFAAGSGNDFWTDIGRKKGDAPIELAKYITGLPVVTVNGKKYRFLNGVGYGIDGYCCEVGDKLKAQDKKVNYSGIAIKGCLFRFKPANAEICVDGNTERFKKVWIAPTMHGRFYGGGMMPTPSQDRLDPECKATLCVFHGTGRLKTLMIFPSLFKGEHVKRTKHVRILSGKQITVKFDKPCALQIDGETILDVTEYTVTAE